METRVTGIVSPAEALLAIAEAYAQAEGRAWYELVEHDDHAVIDVDYVSGSAVVERARAFLETLTEGAVAFVAGQDVSYGRCRQIQIRLEPSPIALEVFRRGDEARTWLEARRSQRARRAPPPSLQLTIEPAPAFDRPPKRDQLIETWRVLRGELEPRDEGERRSEVPIDPPHARRHLT